MGAAIQRAGRAVRPGAAAVVASSHAPPARRICLPATVCDLLMSMMEDEADGSVLLHFARGAIRKWEKTTVGRLPEAAPSSIHELTGSPQQS